MLGRSPQDSSGKLRPEMASFRLLVLAFVSEYISRYKVSPSQGEIRHALDTDRSRVRNALRSLEKDGLILRRPGERGLALPSVRDEAIRQLRQLGFTVDEDIGRISALLPPPELDYPETREPLSQNGDGHGPQGEGARKGAQRALGEDP